MPEKHGIFDWGIGGKGGGVAISNGKPVTYDDGVCIALPVSSTAASGDLLRLVMPLMANVG